MAQAGVPKDHLLPSGPSHLRLWLLKTIPGPDDWQRHLLQLRLQRRDLVALLLGEDGMLPAGHPVFAQAAQAQGENARGEVGRTLPIGEDKEAAVVGDVSEATGTLTG